MTKARDLANAGTALTTVSPTELGYLDGVTSAIQTQVDAKIAKTLTTTTGDIIYASGADTPARLGIGSTDQVLKVTGGVPAWATPSSGGMTLLSTTSLTGSSVTISSISGSYKNLRLIIKDVYTSTVADTHLRLNADTGSNYTFARIRVNGTTVAGGNSVGGTFIQVTSPNTTTDTPLEKGFGIVYLPRYTDTDQQEVTSTSFGYWNSLPTYYSLSGNYNKSAAITSLTIFTESGTFSGGTAYLYGES